MSDIFLLFFTVTHPEMEVRPKLCLISPHLSAFFIHCRVCPHHHSHPTACLFDRTIADPGVWYPPPPGEGCLVITLPRSRHAKSARPGSLSSRQLEYRRGYYFCTAFCAILPPSPRKLAHGPSKPFWPGQILPLRGGFPQRITRNDTERLPPGNCSAVRFPFCPHGVGLGAKGPSPK